MYKDSVRALLSPAERKIFAKLNSPQKIQDYLDTFPINFELEVETYMSPRRAIAVKTAHCFEGALIAAAAFAYHGQKPLLLDLRTKPSDDDHAVALFKQNGRWGAISKTNHPVLRYRDPVYASVRELAMSYFHEYFLDSGNKTLIAFSAAFDLSQYKPERWVTATEELDWLVQASDRVRHFPIAPPAAMKKLRKASKFEVKASAVREWEPR